MIQIFGWASLPNLGYGVNGQVYCLVLGCSLDIIFGAIDINNNNYWLWQSAAENPHIGKGQLVDVGRSSLPIYRAYGLNDYNQVLGVSPTGGLSVYTTTPVPEPAPNRPAWNGSRRVHCRSN